MNSWSFIPMRLKLLCLLLAVSLIPVGVITITDYKRTRKLGKDLSNQTQKKLTDDIQLQLQQWINEKSGALRLQRQLLNQILKSQARDVERVLASAPSKSVPLYFSEEFDHPPKNFPSLIQSPKYVLYDPKTGKDQFIPVSFQAMALHLAPGTKRSQVEPDLIRLGMLTDAYEFNRQGDPEVIFLQYTSLENGASNIFPGHGGSPPNFDPRVRDWYLKAKLEQRLIGIGPYFDASTRELVLTLAMPVYGPGKKFAGVTGLDISVSDMTKMLKLSEDWPPNTFAMLVGLEKQNDKWGIKAFVRHGYVKSGQSEHESFKPEWLESPDSIKLEQLISKLQNRQSGLEQNMKYLGEPCFWGYGPLDEFTNLLVIIPRDAVLAKAHEAKEQAAQHTENLQREVFTFIPFLILIVLLIASVGTRTVTRPLHQLADAVCKVSGGDFQTRVNIRTRDEIQDLGETFNKMIPQLEDRMKIKRSLALAQEVQQQLLPQQAPELPGLDIAGCSVYCDEIGGDYYDFLEWNEKGRKQFGVVIGDVTGHGIAPALLMASVRALLHADFRDGLSSEELMTQVNRQLAGDVTGGRFMTLFYMVMDVETRTVQWISAGHDPALHFSAATKSVRLLEGKDLPLGIDPESKYHASEVVKLEKGDVVVLGTDGIWESQNPQEERFGKERLKDVVVASANQSANGILDSIVQAAKDFRQTHPQEDDVTAVVIKLL